MLLARHRVRFLELADIFLASGMVPAYTAAAFIKKFARLALNAPPAGEEGGICAAGWLGESHRTSVGMRLRAERLGVWGQKVACWGLTADRPDNS